MKRICPWAKLIVMLRNPTERAYSQYNMIIDPTGTPEQLQNRRGLYNKLTSQSFLDIIKEEIQYLRSNNITPDCSYEIFQEKILSTLPLTHGGHSIVARGLYILQLQQWLTNWPAEQIQIYTINDIKNGKERIQDTLNKVFEYLNIPPHDLIDSEAKNTRKYDPILEEAKCLLDDFYEPFNLKLFELLGKELQW